MGTTKNTFETGLSRVENTFFSGYTIYLSKRAGVNAFGILSFGGNAANNDTVIIGGKIYTFLTTLTQLNGNVLIGPSTEDSIENLVAAISLGPGAGSIYGAPTTQQDNIISVRNLTTMDVFAREIGPGGNTITTTETGANLSWGAATLQSGAFLDAAQDNNNLITLPTTPLDGTNYTWVTLDNGITNIDGKDYFSKWTFASPLAEPIIFSGSPFDIRKVLRTVEPFPSTTNKLVLSNTPGSTIGFPYLAGDSLELIYFNNSWRGTGVFGSRVIGAADLT